MNELAVIASETHEKAIAYFKVTEQYCYKFIMEVKKIRDERLYKEIGFTSFEAYCESAWQTKRDFMDERIKIAMEFGEDFDGTYRQLGHSKSLTLARMEPEIKQQIESTIDVNEATVKQLNQLEKQLKEVERERLRLENNNIYQQQELNKERSKPSTVVTKEVQVTPEHVKRELQQKDNQISNLNSSMDVMKSRLSTMENMQKAYEKDSKEYQELKKQINFLHQEKGELHRQIESATALSGLATEIDILLKTKLSPIKYSRVWERMDSEVAVRNFKEILDNVRCWLEDMERYVPTNNRKIVEVVDYEPAS